MPLTGDQRNDLAELACLAATEAGALIASYFNRTMEVREKERICRH
ncbi:MAG: hypothetical protein AAF191_05180 [Verrucomicrobiota bacterium]